MAIDSTSRFAEIRAANSNSRFTTVQYSNKNLIQKALNLIKNVSIDCKIQCSIVATFAVLNCLWFAAPHFVATVVIAATVATIIEGAGLLMIGIAYIFFSIIKNSLKPQHKL